MNLQLNLVTKEGILQQEKYSGGKMIEGKSDRLSEFMVSRDIGRNEWTADGP